MKIDLAGENHALLAKRRHPHRSPTRSIPGTGEDISIPQTRHLHAAQRTNGLVLARDAEGVSSISVLRKMESEGAIVLHSLREDGMSRCETLTRLPESIKSTSDIVLLNPFQGGDSGMVRLVLNKSPQARYSIADISGNGLPAILERSRSSIPAVIGKSRVYLQDSRDRWEDRQLGNCKRLMGHEDGQRKRARKKC